MPWVKLPFKMEKQYRLPGWDYSNNGYYFVTICTENRENILRNVGTDLCVCASKNKTIGDLTAFGKIVLNWWLEIPKKFNDVCLNEYVMMPNHVHGVVVIKNKKLLTKEMDGLAHNEKAQTDEQKNFGNRMMVVGGEERTHGSVPTIGTNRSDPTQGFVNKFGQVGKLGEIIRWFKTMTTNEYIEHVKENNWPKFHKRIWQPRFHDRIIRNEKEYWAIKQYIKNNPKNWKKDRNTLSSR